MHRPWLRHAALSLLRFSNQTYELVIVVEVEVVADASGVGGDFEGDAKAVEGGVVNAAEDVDGDVAVVVLEVGGVIGVEGHCG